MSLLKPSAGRRLMTLAGPMLLFPGAPSDREMRALMSAVCDLAEERGAWGSMTPEAAAKFVESIPVQYREKFWNELAGMMAALSSVQGGAAFANPVPLRLMAGNE